MFNMRQRSAWQKSSTCLPGLSRGEEMADPGFYVSINTPAQMHGDWPPPAQNPGAAPFHPRLTWPQGFPTCPGSKSRCQPPTEAEPQEWSQSQNSTSMPGDVSAGCWSLGISELGRVLITSGRRTDPACSPAKWGLEPTPPLSSSLT